MYQAHYLKLAPSGSAGRMRPSWEQEEALVTALGFRISQPVPSKACLGFRVSLLLMEPSYGFQKLWGFRYISALVPKLHSVHLHPRTVRTFLIAITIVTILAILLVINSNRDDSLGLISCRARERPGRRAALLCPGLESSVFILLPPWSTRCRINTRLSEDSGGEKSKHFCLDWARGRHLPQDANPRRSLKLQLRPEGWPRGASNRVQRTRKRYTTSCLCSEDENHDADGDS